MVRLHRQRVFEQAHGFRIRAAAVVGKHARLRCGDQHVGFVRTQCYRACEGIAGFGKFLLAGQ